MINTVKKSIKDEIIKIFEDIPCYGYIKVQKELLERGHHVCINTVHQYRKQLFLRAVLAVHLSNTSWNNKQHPKHTYKIRGLDIIKANQVWSTDITYIGWFNSINMIYLIIFNFIIIEDFMKL